MATHRHIRVEGPLLLENPFYELPEDAMTIPRDGEAIDEKLAQIDSMSAAS